MTSKGYLAMSVYIWGCHSLGRRRGAAGIRWVEVKNAAKYTTTCRTAPQRLTRIIWPKMSVVPRWQNPDLVAGYYTGEYVKNS